jgi:hypothetical protein
MDRQDYTAEAEAMFRRFAERHGLNDEVETPLSIRSGDFTCGSRVPDRLRHRMLAACSIRCLCFE